MSRPLQVVSSAALPEPPYGPDVKANGYRLELDIERVWQSTTWLLAEPLVRPWLLMLWVESWRSVPVASYEADDGYIAARLGCKLEWFQVYREQLLRGWIRHSDGRLYHKYLTDKVLEMLNKRQLTAKRVQRWRAENKGSAVVDELNRKVCNALVTQRNRSIQSTSCSSSTSYSQNTQYSCSADSLGSSVEPAVPVDRSSRNPFHLTPEERAELGHCPYERIRGLWQKILPELPQPAPASQWTKNRKDQVRRRWMNELPDLSVWERLFTDIRGSEFLMGRVQPMPGRRPFVADLFWVIRPENLLKIAEGRYHR